MALGNNVELGIREVRQVSNSLREKFGVDYSEYALTSFRRRIENILRADGCTLDTLLSTIGVGDRLDSFMGRIAVETTEIFRDPTYWVLLKTKYIQQFLTEGKKPRIWLPMLASGEELYSLLIIMKEAGWLGKIDVTVSTVSDYNLKTIKSGRVTREKLEMSNRNFPRIMPVGKMEDYFAKAGDDMIFDSALMANVNFIKQDLNFNVDLPLQNMILFRNQFIYYIPMRQRKVAKILYDKLAVRGVLTLGVMEELDSTVQTKFLALNKAEGIYQKRI